jgi:hypothetical protein
MNVTPGRGIKSPSLTDLTVEPSTVTSISTSCPSLRRLDLNVAELLNENPLHVLNCTSLEDVRLHTSPAVGDESFDENLTRNLNLKRLKLSGGRPISDVGIGVLCDLYPNVEALQLPLSDTVTGCTLRLVRLRYLWLERCGVSDELLATFPTVQSSFIFIFITRHTTLWTSNCNLFLFLF